MRLAYSVAADKTSIVRVRPMPLHGFAGAEPDEGMDVAFIW